MKSNNYIYLNDTTFLIELSSSPILSSLVRILFLDWNENIINQIESKVASGNISIDGNSSLRRTGSLSLIFNNDQNVEDLFLINKKISIEIGYQNTTDKYQDFPIIWFPQGVFIITNYSLSHGLDGLTVSLGFKDKMCLLNGECGGTLPASTVFDNYETLDENGDITILRPTIYQIIQQLVNHFGGEDLNRIIISDLDLRVKQVMSWNQAIPLYLVLKDNKFEYLADEEDYLKAIEQEGATDIYGSPFQQGANVGFTYTDFTYPGDLIGDAGQSVVDILQQIKETLGNYEFFYDVNGNFVFQEIKNFLNNTQSKYILDSLNDNKLVPDYLSSSRQAYLLDRTDGRSVLNLTKEGKILISSYSNAPQIENIKNDFIVWGIRNTSGKTELPIRYHLAIDKKPPVGNTYEVFKIFNEELGVDTWHKPLIFDKKADFPKRGNVDSFYLDLSSEIIYQWKPNDTNPNIYEYVALADTKMEKVTTKDWRTELYFQGVVAEVNGTESNSYYAQLKNEWPKIYDIKPDVQQEKQFIKYPRVRLVSTNWIKNNKPLNRTQRYYAFDPVNPSTPNHDSPLTEGKLYVGARKPDGTRYFKEEDMTGLSFPQNETELPWGYFDHPTYIDLWATVPTGEWVNLSDFREEVIKYPDQINYYLDFIDTTENISKYSISNIGRRTKVINDGKNSNCIFEAYIPDIVFIPSLNIISGTSEDEEKNPGDMTEALRQECIMKGQDFYQIQNLFYNNLIVGGTQYSCYESIRQTLHEYLGYNESISIQTLPLYFLEPNTCIKVQDKESNIDGDYLVYSFSFDLGNNPEMTINASKIIQKI